MRLYRFVLHLYPASFRAEYGDEMCAVFRERRRDAEGVLAGIGFWLETLLDVVTSAFRVHADLLAGDLAFAVRTFRRAPGFALTVVAVSALGVGATTAAFSVTDHVLFRRLGFSDPDRLVKVDQEQRARGYSHVELSPGNYRDWKRQNRSFASMGAFTTRAFNLSGDGEPERVEAAAVTVEVLDLLGVRPLAGRVFGPADGDAGAPDTVVLGHGLWQARFGGDRGVLGRAILLDGVPYLVIGVMPPDFHFPSRDAELWTALRFRPDDYEDRGNDYIHGVARLRPGVTVAQAQAEMQAVAERLAREFPQDNARTGAAVFHFRDELPSQARLLPLALLGAAGGVLLIACTNLTSLLLARAMVRTREMAVRAALGAGRERLVRQLLTESIVLALLGGALGLLLAAAGVPLLSRLVPNSLPIAETPAMDARVALFAVALTAAAGIAFGTLPAFRAAGQAGVNGLAEGGRGGVGGRRERARALLVMAEVAASVVLLVCCGLLLRALLRVQAVEPGFRTEGVLTVGTPLPLPRYAPTAVRERFYRRVLSDVRALPGVSSAAYISSLPMTRRGGVWPVILRDVAQDPGTRPLASLRFVTPGFFATLGIPIRAGRDVSEADTREAPWVAVVSESMARRHWPGQDPIGHEFEFGLARRRIVGVVGDIRVRGLERASEPQVYLPSAQVEDDSIIGYIPQDLAVRAEGDPTSLAAAIRAAVRAADPQQPISSMRPLGDIVAGETAPRRVQVRVLAAFAATALVLAAVGLHGLLAFAVSSRRQEIGVRMALGARAGHILGLVLREALAMAATGVALGLVLAAAAGRSMEALLFGVPAADAVTLLAAVGLSLVTTLAGSLLPALRALGVDPLGAMRVE